jgi:hypothetical protein
MCYNGLSSPRQESDWGQYESDSSVMSVGRGRGSADIDLKRCRTKVVLKCTQHMQQIQANSSDH